MKSNLFHGVTTALITPFLDNREVDYEGLRQNVRFQIRNGVRGLLPLGTTGETPTLNAVEMERIVRLVVVESRTSNEDTAVLVGVGTNSTQKTIENAKKAEDWGADALLVVTPYYNKPTQDGIVAHFSAVNAACDLPIVIYNIKGRTGTNIQTPTLKQIAALDNVIGVKEASGDIHQMMAVLTEIPELAVYSGDDAMTFPLICLGGQGVISVVSNLFPDLVVKMVKQALAGDVEQARRTHFNLLPIFQAAFMESNPGPVKYAMGQAGLAAGSLRLPLVEMNPTNRASMDAILLQYTR
ncbi:MAG: 4-hydroxy-tetrahydrodipicolinate synthase [Chloroflexi bacterium]|nr:4-hydroxy-tetrahydrodipicolinate synthase [Chloroflexota bacterium]